MIRLLIAAGILSISTSFVGFFGFGETGFSDVDDYGFVLHENAAHLTLIDLSKDKLAGRIETPFAVSDLEVLRDDNTLIAAGTEDNRLAFIDIAEPEAMEFLKIPFVPGDLLLSPDAVTLAVAAINTGEIALIDLKNRRVHSVIEGASGSVQITFANGSDYLFVPDGASGEVRVIDVYGGYEVDPIAVSLTAASEPLSSVTRTPNGLFGVVVDPAASEAALINFRSWRQDRILPTGRMPTRPYITADGRFMMIANQADRTIDVISTDYFETAARLPGLSDIVSVSTGYFETVAFVVSQSERKAVIVDLEALEAGGEIVFSGTPGPAVGDADGLRIYVPIRETGEIVVIGTQSREILSRIPTATDAPVRVHLARTNNYCH